MDYGTNVHVATIASWIHFALWVLARLLTVLNYGLWKNLVFDRYRTQIRFFSALPVEHNTYLIILLLPPVFRSSLNNHLKISDNLTIQPFLVQFCIFSVNISMGILTFREKLNLKGRQNNQC